jgi:hypothetical protein
MYFASVPTLLIQLNGIFDPLSNPLIRLLLLASLLCLAVARPYELTCFSTGIKQQIENGNLCVVRGMDLRVLRVVINHPFDRNIVPLQEIRIQVVSRGGSADVVCGSDRLEDRQKPLRLRSPAMQFRASQEFCLFDS